MGAVCVVEPVVPSGSLVGVVELVGPAGSKLASMTPSRGSLDGSELVMEYTMLAAAAGCSHFRVSASSTLYVATSRAQLTGPGCHGVPYW